MEVEVEVEGEEVGKEGVEEEKKIIRGGRGGGDDNYRRWRRRRDAAGKGRREHRGGEGRGGHEGALHSLSPEHSIVLRSRCFRIPREAMRERHLRRLLGSESLFTGSCLMYSPPPFILRLFVFVCLNICVTSTCPLLFGWIHLGCDLVPPVCQRRQRRCVCALLGHGSGQARRRRRAESASPLSTHPGDVYVPGAVAMAADEFTWTARATTLSPKCVLPPVQSLGDLRRSDSVGLLRTCLANAEDNKTIAKPRKFQLTPSRTPPTCIFLDGARAPAAGPTPPTRARIICFNKQMGFFIGYI